MTAVLGPAPVLGWEASDDEWRAARQTGVGASDVAALLGFSRRSPYQVWLEKTGRGLGDQDNRAAALGRSLEDWLVAQSSGLLREPVARTEYRLYAHAEHSWRLCSPDAVGQRTGRLVETKTAGIASGWGPPVGWDSEFGPLGYELQVRWAMHVLDSPAGDLVGLVANMGLVHLQIPRDLALEEQLVGHVTDWWTRHVVGDREPPASALDVPTLQRRFPGHDVDETPVELPKRAQQLIARRHRAKARLDQLTERVATYDAQMRQRLGRRTTGQVDGQTVVTWNPRRGSLSWKSYARQLEARALSAGVTLPDLEQHRGTSSRALDYKDVN